VDLTPKFIDVAGTCTRYHEVGQGEPTILIHGGGPGASGLSNYRKNVEPLAGGRRVILVDFAGLLARPKASSRTDRFSRRWGDFVRVFMDAIKVDKASFRRQFAGRCYVSDGRAARAGIASTDWC